MPVQGLPPKQVQDTTLYGIGSVDLRTDEDLAATESVQECLNFDLHVSDGVATTRRMRRVVASLGAQVVTIQRAGENIYAATETGVLYRDWSQIDTGYGDSVTIQEYVSMNRAEGSVYVAGANKMRRLHDEIIHSWGVDRPSRAPSLATQLNVDASETPKVDGAYSVVYTYVVKQGSEVVIESNPSPASEIVINQAINLSTSSAIAVTVYPPSDVQVTHIRVYRTQDSGPLHLFDSEVHNTGANQVVYLVKADNDLGAAVDEDNDPPIVSSKFVIFQDRAWLTDDYNVYYSKKYQPQAFPQLNYLTIGNRSDPVVGIVASRYGLGVFTRRRRIRILESVENISAIGDTLPFFGGSETSFIPVPSPDEKGGIAPKGIVDATEGVIYASDDGLYMTDFQADQPVSLKINGIFLGRQSDHLKPVSRLHRGNTVLGVHESRRFFSYTEEGQTRNSKTWVFSADNGKWYAYDVGVSAIYSDPRTGYLYLGSPDGSVGIYDDYTRDVSGTISAYLSTHELHCGLPFANKLAQWLYVAADVDERDTLSGNLYVDGELLHSFVVTGRGRVRLPGGLFGATYRVALAYSGSHTCRIRGIQLLWIPMMTY